MKQKHEIVEDRRTVKRFVVEFKVTVTVDWPLNCKEDHDDIIEHATGIVPQCDSAAIPDGYGKAVWSKRFADVDWKDAEIIEEHEVK